MDGGDEALIRQGRWLIDRQLEIEEKSLQKVDKLASIEFLLKAKETKNLGTSLKPESPKKSCLKN